ncbi:MAG: Bax inhibitor-1/YccA family membrane protein, partial [Acidimicrobiales bacterium]
MASSNPAMNDKIFERETKASGTGAFTPGWGSPAAEVPPGLFGGGRGTMPPPTGSPVTQVGAGGTMRLSGSLSAAAILLAILVTAGWFGWQAVTVVTTTDLAGKTQVVSRNIPGWIIGALIVGFVLALVTIFKPKVARFTGPLYAVAEGLFVGAIS